MDDKFITVSISSATACSSCHAENSCSLSGKEEKTIEISGRYPFKPGDNVTVQMKQSMGYLALFLGYLLPLISVMLILVILTSMDIHESIVGMVSIMTLVPYYTLLYFVRNRINNRFTFTLKG